jgi:uncharacterized protein (TIGR03083 family)
MFADDLVAFAEVQDALLRLMRDAAPGDWALASGGCPGWTVGDIFLHLGLTLAQFADRRSLPRVEGLGAERVNDVLVEHRRPWTHQQVIDDYTANLRATLDRMREIGDGTDRVLDLGDIGSYPFADLVKAYVWDHVTHMTCDVVAPDGPVGLAGPPATEGVMRPAVDWIFTALPQQVRDVPALGGTIRLDLRGPGGRQVGLSAVEGRFAVSDAPGDETVATVTSSTADLLRWATQRRSWRVLDVTITGDRNAVAPALDVIRVF